MHGTRARLSAATIGKAGAGHPKRVGEDGMNAHEIAILERHFPQERDQEKAIWYIRSAKVAISLGYHPTKDRIWDQYCHSAMIWGIRSVLEPHKIETYLPMLRELQLLDEVQV